MEIDFGPAFSQLRLMGTGLIRALPNIAIALVIFMLFIAAASWVRRGIEATSRRYGKHDSLSTALGRLGQSAFTLLGFLIAAVILFPEFTPGDLLGVLGFGSVAIGFAFRDILQNFLAGVLLLITEPFRVGDQIIFEDYEGTVEHIETRATLLHTYDGRRVVIPNGELYTKSFVVNTAYDKRRMEVDLDVGYEDDIEMAKAVILEVLHGIKEILPDPPPEVLVTEWREAAVGLRVRWWVTPPRRRDTLVSRDEVLQRLKGGFQAKGLSLPFPVRQVLFYDKTPPGGPTPYPFRHHGEGGTPATNTREPIP